MRIKKAFIYAPDSRINSIRINDTECKRTYKYLYNMRYLF